MSTFDEMTVRVADDINRSDLTTQIKKAINRAIKYYERKRTYFNETESFTTTVSGTANYAVPSDQKEIDILQITVNSSKYPLIRRSYGWYTDHLQNTSYTGVPTDYAVYKQELFLYPTPNGAYRIDMSYSKSFTELSATSDTHAFLTEAEGLIEARARWWLYTRILKQPDLAIMAKQEEKDEWSAIVEETEKRLFSGKVRSTHF